MADAPYTPPPDVNARIYPGVIESTDAPSPAYTSVAPTENNDDFSTDEETGLLKGLGDAVGVTDEIAAGLTSLNNQLKGVQTADGVLSATGIMGCVGDLAKTLISINRLYDEDGAETQKLANCIAKPIADAANLFKDIFVPSSDAPDGSSLQAMMNSIVNALKNPLTTMFELQSSVLQQSLGQLYDQAFSATSVDANGGTTEGFVPEFVDRIKMVGKSLLFSPNAEGNMIAIYIFAFKHGVPAIETELRYLKRMKKISATVSEQVSFIPPHIDINLANASLLVDLCEAEEALKFVSKKLRYYGEFDRGTMEYAGKAICHARDTIYDGKTDSVGSLLKKHGANFMGLSQGGSINLGNLAKSPLAQVLPNIKFRLACAELQLVGNQFAKQDQYVVRLYDNITSAVTTLEQLKHLPLGEMLSLIVDILRRQVSALRVQLEANGAGISADKVSEEVKAKKDIADYIRTEGERLQIANASDSEIRQFYADIKSYSDQRMAGVQGLSEKQQIDIWSYVSTMVSAYAMLAVLCRVMQVLPRIFSTIEKILDVQRGFANALQVIIGRFDARPCGDRNGGNEVIARMNDLIRACQDHINRRSIQSADSAINSTKEIETASKALTIAIKKREKFLRCMKSHLFFGLGWLSDIFTGIADAVALLDNIAAIALQFADLYDTLKTADLNRLLGLNGQSYSALEALIKAVRCLVLNCDNPALSTITNDILVRVGDTASQKKSATVNMSTMDELPALAKKVKDNDRLKRLLELVALINKIMNLDFSAICEVTDPAGQKKPGHVSITDAELAETAFKNKGDFQASQQKYYDFAGTEESSTVANSYNQTNPAVGVPR
jgi:hypothetical protein